MSHLAVTGAEVLRHRVARLDRSVPGEIYAGPEVCGDPDATRLA